MKFREILGFNSHIHKNDMGQGILDFTNFRFPKYFNVSKLNNDPVQFFYIAMRKLRTSRRITVYMKKYSLLC